MLVQQDDASIFVHFFKYIWILKQALLKLQNACAVQNNWMNISLLHPTLIGSSCSWDPSVFQRNNKNYRIACWGASPNSFTPNLIFQKLTPTFFLRRFEHNENWGKIVETRLLGRDCHVVHCSSREKGTLMPFCVGSGRVEATIRTYNTCHEYYYIMGMHVSNQLKKHFLWWYDRWNACSPFQRLLTDVCETVAVLG